MDKSWLYYGASIIFISDYIITFLYLERSRYPNRYRKGPQG